MISFNFNINDEQSQDLQNHTSHHLVDRKNSDKTLEIKFWYNPTYNMNAEIKTHWRNYYCCCSVDLRTDAFRNGYLTLASSRTNGVHHWSRCWSRYCSCALIFNDIPLWVEIAAMVQLAFRCHVTDWTREDDRRWCGRWLNGAVEGKGNETERDWGERK